MPFGKIHIHHHQKRDGCTGPSLFQSPSQGQTVNALQPVQVEWEASCIKSQYVDLYLFAPTTSSSLIYKWLRIDASSGSFNATMMPRWWGSASSMNLMFQLTDNETPSFLSSYGTGPTFTADYTAPSDGTTPAAADTSIKDQGFTNVTPTSSGSLSTGPHLSKGKIAAAVIMPLLVVVAIVVAYLKWSRSKGLAKRQVWTEKVDQRMSTISTDWKSMSAVGASAAIRHSMADSGNRNSSFSFGAIRPQSVAQDGGQAGVGALYTHKNGSLSQTSQLRPGLRTSAFENRVSRVSFADDPRPRQSTESRRSRAYHTASTYENVPVPPLPKRSMSDDPVGTMSPKQTSGAVSLTAEDITARISADQGNRNSTFDEVLPALSLMRTGFESDETSFPSMPEPTHLNPIDITPPDYYQTVTAPSTTIFSASPLSPNYPTSPVSVNQYGMAIQPMPANVMSPDDMLRAYAERNAAARSSGMGTPVSIGSGTTAPSRYSLGAGIGFGAASTRTSVSYPSTRALTPANPGQYSPSRGAYGVYHPEQEQEQAYVGVAE